MKLQTKKFTKTLIFSAMALSLSACELIEDDEDDVTESENSAPSITSTGVLSIEAGTAYSYTLAASDADGDTLTLEASTLPSWLSFDAGTGVLSGTPSANDEGSHSVTLSVSDGTASTTQSFTINVTVPAVNAAPMVSSTAVTTATEGTEYTYTLTATDADDDTLTMTATTLPAWLSFDTTSGVLSGTPAASDAGDHDVVLTVADAEDSVTESFTITVAALVVDLTPTTGALALFDDSVQTGWHAWDESGAYAPVIATDEDTDRGEVIEYKITGNQVAGFSTRSSHGATNGVIHDASSITADGTFSFDLKMTQDATGGSVAWYVKLESTDAGSAAEFTLSASQEGHSSPVLDTWQTYTFNLQDFADAGLVTSEIDVVMIFPQWGQSDGAMYKLDNVQFNADGADDSSNNSNNSSGTAAIDFETVGDSYTWETFENDSNPGLEIVANPDSSGVNTSATVAKFTALTAGAEWAGILSGDGDFGPVTFDATNSTVKIMVWKSVISDVGIKFQNATDGSQGDIKVANTKVNEWEELTFDFSPQIGLEGAVDATKIAIFPDFAARTQDNVVYFDNISFSGSSDSDSGSSDTAPTDAAPAPTEAADDVVSIYSSYSEAAGLNVDPDWGQATATSITQIASDDTVLMENLNYQGIEFTAVDVSGKATLHIDYWTADATAFDVYLISPGPQEQAYNVTATQGGWQSLEIPLTAFSSVVDLAEVFQFKFVAEGSPTIYFDNMYFSSTDSSSDDSSSSNSVPTDAAPTPSEAADSVVSIFSSYSDAAGLNVDPDWGQATATSVAQVDSNDTILMSNLNYQGIEFTTVDVSGKTTLHLDYWTADATTFDVYLISSGPLETAYTVTATQGGWQSIEIPLTEYSSVVDLADVFQFKFVADGSPTIYFDNLYFD